MLSALESTICDCTFTARCSCLWEGVVANLVMVVVWRILGMWRWCCGDDSYALGERVGLLAPMANCALMSNWARDLAPVVSRATETKLPFLLMD